MKRVFFTFITILFLTGCKQESKNTSSEVVIVSSRLQYEEKTEGLQLQSGKFSYNFKKNEIPFKKTILLNASLLGYFLEINAENTIVGVASSEYIYSSKVKNLIQQGKIQNVGNEQKYNIEKIISLKPDAVFTNYVASFENTYQVLKNNGIKVIFLDEYLEQNPLEKTAYLNLFGKLFGREQLALQKYKEIEDNYNLLKESAQKSNTKPNVLMNEMYGNVWYLPGGKTFMARYVLDANANYILKDNTEEKSVTMSFEEVFTKTKNVKIWVNAGNHQTKNDLFKTNPFYSKLNVAQNGKIYVITAREKQKSNDFYESGVVRADWVLKDYIKISHPEILPNYRLTYMKELQ